MTGRGFNFHEHTADITIECWAPTLEGAFEQAAVAAFEVILDTSTVGSVVPIEVNVKGVDMKELLVEWIGQLIALIDINSQFYSEFEVIEIKQGPDECTLKARAWGEDIDHTRHDTRTEVKAMTYADMQILSEPEKTTLWFTLDL